MSHKERLTTGLTQKEAALRVKANGEKLGLCVANEYKDGEDLIIAFDECIPQKPRLVTRLVEGLKEDLNKEV